MRRPLLSGLLAITAIGLLIALCFQSQAPEIVRTYRFSGAHVLAGSSKWITLASDALLLLAILAVAVSAFRKKDRR